MKAAEIARSIDARLHSDCTLGEAEILRFHAGATMSDLIAHAAPNTLLVTPLNNVQLANVAELMDVPGICLVDGQEPAADLAARARASGIALMTSRGSLEETSAALERMLGA